MVTVEEALRKGHRMVTIPGYIILFTLIGTFIVLGEFEIISNNQIIMGLGISILIPWLFWSFMITKWRLWAFKNVENFDELNSKAIQQKLIWPKGNIFGKTEIRNKREKVKWNNIQKRMKKH